MCSDIGDAKALAENIVAMRNQTSARLREMGENAYAYNKEHFDKRKLMDEMETFVG